MRHTPNSIVVNVTGPELLAKACSEIHTLIARCGSTSSISVTINEVAPGTATAKPKAEPKSDPEAAEAPEMTSAEKRKARRAKKADELI
jgi:hypothetical protein